MKKLSVVLATYNEEKNLADCLESVKSIASEIIIVDGTSSDKTVEIAKSFGAKVIIRQNEKIFHINKQKAIDGATGDWVLQLDADERVTPDLAKEITDTINSTDYDGFWIPRKNWFLGRYLLKGGVYPDYTLRLYKNGKGRLPMRDVHEQAEVEGKVGFLKNPLEHLADPNFSRYLLRFNRYTDLIATQLKDKKTKINPFRSFEYFILFPVFWFFKVYVRHLGFMDGWQGFVWAFFSALRFPVSYSKYIQKK